MLYPIAAKLLPLSSLLRGERGGAICGFNRWSEIGIGQSWLRLLRSLLEVGNGIMVINSDMVMKV